MLLTVNHLSIRFGKNAKPVVNDFSLAIARGQCLGLVGESGSGKSLTALAIMQLLPSTASVSQHSQILYHGNDLLSHSEQQMRRIRGTKISMIFQDASSALNPVYTIGNQLREVIDYHRLATDHTTHTIAYDLLKEVGIHDVEYCLNAYPHQLSGGMRQRAVIAMALAGEPDLLIADEPTTALDTTIQLQIINLLKKIQQHRQMSLLLINHDLAIVSQLASNIVVMRSGEYVESASISCFFQQPKTLYSQQLLAAIPSLKPHHIEQKTAKPLLQVKQLKVYFPIKKGILQRTVDQIKAVDDISFSLARGETVALVGESGCGKTTTAKAILQLLMISGGSVLFNGNNISTQSYQKMQIIFQDPYQSLNPRFMIFNCIAEGLLAQHKVKNKQQAIDRVNQALQQVELEPDAKWRYPHEFSGGQRQRICIARTLALEPELLILDEPTSALDVSIQMQILKLLTNLQSQHNLTYLLITHNLSIVAYLAHRTLVMYRGKIVEQGPTKQILSTPQHNYTQQLIASIPKIKRNNSHDE